MDTTIRLTRPDGTTIDHDATAPAPAAYDAGYEPAYPTTITEIALIRAAIAANDAADAGRSAWAPVVLAADAGYGAMIENADDPIAIERVEGGWTAWIGPNEHELDAIGPHATIADLARALAPEIR
jgi:hypothetical protein